MAPQPRSAHARTWQRPHSSQASDELRRPGQQQPGEHGAQAFALGKVHAAGEHVVVDGAQAREHGGGAAHDGAQFAAQAAAHGVDHTLAWTIGGLPFLTTPGPLVDAVRDAIRTETGLETQLSTTGGTSDGRFIAQVCPQVIELGPPNATIHKINEYVKLADIEPLKNIYRRVLENLNQAETS